MLVLQIAVAVSAAALCVAIVALVQVTTGTTAFRRLLCGLGYHKWARRQLLEATWWACERCPEVHA